MTKIEWCDETVNPIRARNVETGKVGWHCEHVDEGCRNCYAERQNKAGARGGTKFDYKPSHVDQGRVEVFLDEKVLAKVLALGRKDKKPRSIFWCSMTDLFGRFVTDELSDRCFATMALTPQHRHIVLTKRAWLAWAWVEARRHKAQDMVDYLESDDTFAKHIPGMAPLIEWPLPNVYIGTSVSDQASADERLPDLLRIAALGWKVWVSYEPALGPVDFTRVPVEAPGAGGTVYVNALTGEGITIAGRCHYSRISTLVCGGESGPGARPMHPDWARVARAACAAAGVPFHFKQWGEHLPPGQQSWWFPCTEAEPELAVPPVAEWPKWLRVGKKAAGRLLDGAQHDALAWSK